MANEKAPRISPDKPNYDLMVKLGLYCDLAAEFADSQFNWQILFDNVITRINDQCENYGDEKEVREFLRDLVLAGRLADAQSLSQLYFEGLDEFDDVVAKVFEEQRIINLDTLYDHSTNQLKELVSYLLDENNTGLAMILLHYHIKNRPDIVVKLIQSTIDVAATATARDEYKKMTTRD